MNNNLTHVLRERELKIAVKLSSKMELMFFPFSLLNKVIGMCHSSHQNEITNFSYCHHTKSV